MAVYGFGAAYAGTEDKVADFIRNNVAMIGYEPADATTLHAVLRQIEVGDIVFLKSFPPSVGLIIKAVGIVTDVSQIGQLRHNDLGYGVDVQWKPMEPLKVGRMNDRYDNMRGGTLYREYNPDILKTLVEILV